MAATPASALVTQMDGLAALLDSMRLSVGQLATNPTAIEHASRYLGEAHASLKAAQMELGGNTPGAVPGTTPPTNAPIRTTRGVNGLVAMSNCIGELVETQQKLQAADARSNSRRLVLSPEEARRICDERDRQLSGSRSA